MSTIASPTVRQGTVSPELVADLAALHTALDGFEAAPQYAAALEIGQTRRVIAGKFALLSKRESPQLPVVASALLAVRRLAAAGALDLPLGDEDQSFLTRSDRMSWPELIAAMLVTPAWRWAKAPLLSQVPDWMWGDYAQWLFANPNALITRDDCAAFAAHITRHTEELARWAGRNLGSASVKAAADAFAQATPLQALRFSEVDVSSAALSRGRILSRLLGRSVEPFEPLLSPRIGRNLRVGFISRDWELRGETCAALARFEQWPTDGVERILFSMAEPVSAFAWHVRDKAQEFHVLPTELGEQVDFVRNSNLDVLVFVGDTTDCDTFSRLALFRLASLQMIHSQSGITSGSAAMDACVVVQGRESRCTTERQAVLPQASATYAMRRGGDFEIAYSREDAGLPADALVLTTVFHSAHEVAEHLDCLVRILAEVPNTRVLVHLLPDRFLSGVAVERFSAVVDAVMRQAGLASDRMSILAPDQATHDESRAIVRIGDIYLSHGGTGLWAAEALAMGIPVVSMNGPESTWLRSEEMGDLVTKDTESLVETVRVLGLDAERRAKIKERLTNPDKTHLACSDALAGSDAMLALIETAYDDMESRGGDQFRRDPKRISAGSEDDLSVALEAAKLAMEYNDPIGAVDAAQRALKIKPHDPHIRALLGRAYFSDGRPDRATIYLLAAAEVLNDDADLWYSLALALRDQGSMSEATQALETSLRLNPKRADGWLMLIQLAQTAGAHEIAQSAYDVLKQTSPDHPELAGLAAQFEH